MREALLELRGNAAGGEEILAVAAEQASAPASTQVPIPHLATACAHHPAIFCCAACAPCRHAPCACRHAVLPVHHAPCAMQTCTSFVHGAAFIHLLNEE